MDGSGSGSFVTCTYPVCYLNGHIHVHQHMHVHVHKLNVQHHHACLQYILSIRSLTVKQVLLWKFPRYKVTSLALGLVPHRATVCQVLVKYVQHMYIYLYMSADAPT